MLVIVVFSFIWFVCLMHMKLRLDVYWKKYAIGKTNRYAISKFHFETNSLQIFTSWHSPICLRDILHSPIQEVSIFQSVWGMKTNVMTKVSSAWNEPFPYLSPSHHRICEHETKCFPLGMSVTLNFSWLPRWA